jgi:hypothetical protein
MNGMPDQGHCSSKARDLPPISGEYEPLQDSSAFTPGTNAAFIDGFGHDQSEFLMIEAFASHEEDHCTVFMSRQGL